MEKVEGARSPGTPTVTTTSSSFSSVLKLCTKRAPCTAAKSGKEVGMVKNGRVGAIAMILGAEKENEFQTWMLRGVGFAMMMIGTMMITSPIGHVAGPHTIYLFSSTQKPCAPEPTEVIPLHHTKMVPGLS